MPDTHGSVCWSELNTRDIAAARTWYETVCGWTFDVVPMPDGPEYYIGKIGDQMIAGMFDMTGMPGMENLPPHWLTYLAVDDVDAAVAQGEEKGGTTIRPPFDVEGVGRIAIVQDASGAGLGIMTPSS